MAKLPEKPIDSKTVQSIYQAYERTEDKRWSRRLGASGIGNECERSLWYSFRWCSSEKFDGRLLRLFETGNLAEDRFAANLRSIGCEVHTEDPQTESQFEFSEVAGHLVCKLDGAALGIPEAPKAWHACEFKTHSAKNFKAVQSKGIKQAKPQHYAQLVVGMALSGMKRGLYLAVNKDTDELYSERLRWEEVKDDAASLLEKASRIVKSTHPPAGISEDRDFFACKFCTFRELCHGSNPPGPAVPCKVTCRTCVHATAEMDTDRGRWSCTKHKKTLSDQEQEKSCDDHLFIPALVTFAQVADAGYDDRGDWTEYQNEDGTTWRNGRQDGQYRSVELTVLPSPMVGAGLVDDVKHELGAEAVEVGVEG